MPRITAWLPFLVLVACGTPDDGPDDSDDVDDTDSPPAAGTLVGSWAVDGDPTLDWLPGAGTLRHVRFGATGEAGAGTLETFGDNASDERFCDDISWSQVTAGTVAIGYEPYRAGALLAGVRFIDADTVELVDEGGDTLRLVREAEVPESARCGTAAITDGVSVTGADDVEIAWWSNLVWDGAALRYPTEYDGTYRVDPTTGELSNPWTFGSDQYRLPLAVEDEAAWVTCGCGRVDEIKLTEPGGTVRKEVNVTDLGSQPLSIYGAYVPEDGELVLFVNQSGGESRFVMRVNTVPASPTLVSLSPTELSPFRLTEHDGALWAVSEGRKLLRIDPDTGTALDSLLVEGLGRNEQVRGLASDGSRLWAVRSGPGSTDDFRLAEITLP